MAGPVYVRITADVADVTAKLALAKAEFAETNAALRSVAQEMRAAGTGASEELKAGLAQAAQAAATARAEMASLNTQLKESMGASAGAASLNATSSVALATSMPTTHRIAGSSIRLPSRRDGTSAGSRRGSDLASRVRCPCP